MFHVSGASLAGPITQVVVYIAPVSVELPMAPGAGAKISYPIIYAGSTPSQIVLEGKMHHAVLDPVSDAVGVVVLDLG